MDWSSIICAGIGGGLGAAIGVLVGKAIPESKRNLRFGVMVAVAVIMARVIPETPVKAAIDRALFTKSRFQRMAEEAGRDLTVDKAFVARVQSLPAAERSTHSQRLGRQGLYWLSGAELDQWNSLRLGLAAASPKLCAGLLTGHVSVIELEQAFEALSDEQAREWFRLSNAAVKAAIANEKNFDSTRAEEEMQDGLNLVLSVIGESDSQKLTDMLQNAGSKSESDMCWATKTLHDGAKKLEPPDRQRFLRGFASAG